MIAVQRDGGTVCFVVSGEIDLSNADTLEVRLENEIDSRVSDVIVDLTKVEYIDSAGVRVMFTLAARLGTRQIELRVEAPSGSPVRRVLEIAGFPLLPSDG